MQTNPVQPGNTPPPVKLLLVDDEEPNLLAMQMMLADLGHPIVTARSAQDAFRCLLQDSYALLLLDVAMPGLNGLELARLLHEREDAYLTPIIFITAHYNDAESVASSYQAGGVDYLIKPINPDILRAKVRVFAQLGQARHQLEWEIAERRRAELSLQHLNSMLEQRVAKRTSDLTRANKALVSEIAERKQAETELLQAKCELARINENLEAEIRVRTERLQEALDDLEHFCYTIAHDMRAPLRAMHGFAGILSEPDGPSMKEEHRDYLRRIMRASQRMDHLIMDALNYGNTVRREMPITTVDADALIRGMIDSYPAFQPPRAEIHIEGSLPSLVANEAGLTQCFSNILDNAVKFVAPGVIPAIHIYAEARPGCADARGKGSPIVRLWFEDNGIGIAKEMQPKIFDMFQRASNDYEGTGIGLALVRKVAMKMGGSVGVESEPGRGSRFWLDLRHAGDQDVTSAVSGSCQ